MIPYGRQCIDESDVAAVVEVLRGDWLTQGPMIERLERALGEITGARHVVAFANGTAALHGATAAAGLGPGHQVVTSPLSFAASAACALYVGSSVRFLDIDSETLNLDPRLVPSDCDALVAVHYAGLPMDLEQLSFRPPVVIEDAAHALGASTPDGPVGNCARSDMCTFSFHPVKAITAGEGGAVTTNDETLARRLRRFRNHGIERLPEVAGWHYEIDSLGYNYRLTDIQAALACSQLKRLDEFIFRRNELAQRYRHLLAGLPVALPPLATEGFRHAYHLFTVRVPDRRRVYDGLRAAGIGVQVHYIPIYRHPVFAPSGSPAGCPRTEDAAASILSLPLFPGLTFAQQDRVITVLEELL